MNPKIIIIMSAIAFFLAIFSMAVTILNIQSQEIPNQTFNVQKTCSNLSLFKTSVCLEESLASFYNYNLSNANKEITLDQLETEGGVCSHYSNWYESQLTGSKFYIQRIILPINNQTNHVMNIISNEEGYCVLDQIQNQCWRWKNGSL